MARYNQRPPQVDAIQLRDDTWAEIQATVLDPADDIETITAADATDTCGDPGPDYLAVAVTTVHGERVRFTHGDWIVIHGPRAFVCFTPDRFTALYAPA